MIPYKNLPEADYTAALTGLGLPEPLARAYASYDVGASQGALFDDGGRLSALIGRPTTSLATAVADALKQAQVSGSAFAIGAGLPLGALA